MSVRRLDELMQEDVQVGSVWPLGDDDTVRVRFVLGH
jgi:hypothetical protein